MPITFHTMAASMKGVAYHQFDGDVQAVPVSNAASHKSYRIREVNRDKVEEYKESIRERGLIQPVGMGSPDDPTDPPYAVIFGHTRWFAWKEIYDETQQAMLDAQANEDPSDPEGAARIKAAEKEFGRWQFIPAVVYNKDMTADSRRITAIEENLLRDELTPKQREVFAAERAMLRAKIYGAEMKANAKAAKTNGTAIPAPVEEPRKWPKGWWPEFYTNDLKLKETAARDKWNAYKKATGVEHSTSKATDDEIDGFLAWLQSQRKSVPKEVAVEIDARDADRAAGTDYLVRYEEKYDDEGVKEIVRDWWKRKGKVVEFR